MKKEKEGLPFGPAPTAATRGCRTRLWPFTLRAEPAIFFEGRVAEEMRNLYYTFGMADDDDPVEKALMASSSATITSEDSVNSNLATLMVDSGASGHYFYDAIICDLKHRLQNHVHLTTPRKILIVREAMLDGITEGVLRDLVNDDYGNQNLDRVYIVVWGSTCSR